MKIICLQENLKNALNTTERIIGRNLTLPILNNLLLETDKGRLKISSTNLEIGINYWISGKIEKDGVITVPAKILSNFVNNLPNKKIEFEVKSGVLYLKCENYRAQIKGQDAKDFPIIPKIQPKITNSIDLDVLKIGLSQVVGVATVSESRPEISGILFNFNKNNLKLVATDSFRLSEKTINIENLEEESVIIPQRTIQELIRILIEVSEFKEVNNQVKIVLSNNQVLFDLGDIQLISRLIDGQYPNYQQIIPTSFRTKVILNKEDFIKAIKIASIFSSKINDIKFIISLKKGFEVFAQNTDIGENKSQINAEIEGDPLEISFNWRYILDGLNNITSQKIFFGLNTGDNPVILKPIGDESYLYVVMPIKAS